MRLTDTLTYIWYKPIDDDDWSGWLIDGWVSVCDCHLLLLSRLRTSRAKKHRNAPKRQKKTAKSKNCRFFLSCFSGPETVKLSVFTISRRIQNLKGGLETEETSYRRHVYWITAEDLRTVFIAGFCCPQVDLIEDLLQVSGSSHLWPIWFSSNRLRCVCLLSLVCFGWRKSYQSNSGVH